MDLTEKIDYSKKYAGVVARAWSDPSYKEQLLANPKQVLSEAGMTFAAGTDVQISAGASQMTRETGDQSVVVLPFPEKPGDLSDEALVGDGNGITLCTSCCCCA